MISKIEELRGIDVSDPRVIAYGNTGVNILMVAECCQVANQMEGNKQVSHIALGQALYDDPAAQVIFPSLEVRDNPKDGHLALLKYNGHSIDIVCDMHLAPEDRFIGFHYQIYVSDVPDAREP